MVSATPSGRKARGASCDGLSLVHKDHEDSSKDQTVRNEKVDKMDPIKVAVADANILLREGLKRVLAAESDLLIVGETEIDVEVLDLVERTKPDVLLLDIELPKRKAVPILLELTQKNLHTKVLIFSHNPDQESILDTAKAGASGYALKCILPSTLIQAIRKIHSGEIWVDRHLECAENFVKLVRQKSDAAVYRLEHDITKALSRRELEILALVASGLGNGEISKKLFVSLPTVKAHINHILKKLNVKNRTLATLLFVKAYPNKVPAETDAEHRKFGG